MKKTITKVLKLISLIKNQISVISSEDRNFDLKGRNDFTQVSNTLYGCHEILKAFVAQSCLPPKITKV